MIEKQAINKMAIKPVPLMHPEGIKESGWTSFFKPPPLMGGGWGRVKSFVQFLFHSFRSTQNSHTTSQPIMSALEIADWARELEAYWVSLPPSKRLSELALFGDQTSRFRGQGMEYEESRAYQPGDELRHLNWRLMARTGKPSTKLFQEERQAQWVLLLDMRASMRFGTRTQLKVTQGLKVAGWLAWLAQKNRVRIQVVAVGEQVSVSPVWQGHQLYQPVMQWLAKPCPPIPADQIELNLFDVIDGLKQQWAKGSQLMMISDFQQVSDADVQHGLVLSQDWQVTGFWIQDRAEHRLETTQSLRLRDRNTTRLLSREQQQTYTAWAEQDFAERELKLKQAGFSIQTIMADDSLQNWM